MNSTWGLRGIKLASYGKTEIIETVDRLYKVAYDHLNTVEAIIPAQSKVAVTYKSEGNNEVSKSASLQVASYVTSHARVMLYEAFEQIQDKGRIVYCGK